jgi:hypothetical protein
LLEYVFKALDLFQTVENGSPQKFAEMLTDFCRALLTGLTG